MCLSTRFFYFCPHFCRQASASRVVIGLSRFFHRGFFREFFWVLYRRQAISHAKGDPRRVPIFRVKQGGGATILLLVRNVSQGVLFLYRPNGPIVFYSVVDDYRGRGAFLRVLQFGNAFLCACVSYGLRGLQIGL